MKSLISTYKKKFRISIIAALLLTYCLFLYVLSPTYTKHKELEELNRNCSESLNSPNQIKHFKSILEKMKMDVLVLDTNNSSQRNRILNFAEINSVSNNLEIIEIISSLSVDQDNYRLQYNKLTIKGAYKNQMQFFFKYEQNKANDRIVSLRFYSKHNNQKNKTELYSEALIVSIIKNTEA